MLMIPLIMARIGSCWADNILVTLDQIKYIIQMDFTCLLFDVFLMETLKNFNLPILLALYFYWIELILGLSR